MGVPKRSLRRHHIERLKRRRKAYWGRYEKSKRVLGIAANTACVCSCAICGNPRLREGDSISQRRQKLIHAEE